ncbi:uncharacterized protein METZ01_LOCUS6560, partial [marine metagenome]
VSGIKPLPARGSLDDVFRLSENSA